MALQHVMVELIFFSLAIQITKRVKYKSNNFTMYPLDGSLSLSLPFTNSIKTFYTMTNDPFHLKKSHCVYSCSQEDTCPVECSTLAGKCISYKFLLLRNAHSPSSDLVQVLVTLRKSPSSIKLYDTGICSYCYYFYYLYTIISVISNSKQIFTLVNNGVPAYTGT